MVGDGWQAAAMWSKPHMIALDEPTNYLDNDTLAALTHALKKFQAGPRNWGQTSFFPDPTYLSVPTNR